MKRSRFDEEQIIRILKEHEGVLGTADVCRKHGISSATFYKWKANYGGLEVSRDECFNETLFSSLAEARSRITDWKEDYNTQRPHSALGNLTPDEFATKQALEKRAA